MKHETPSRRLQRMERDVTNLELRIAHTGDIAELTRLRLQLHQKKAGLALVRIKHEPL